MQREWLLRKIVANKDGTAVGLYQNSAHNHLPPDKKPAARTDHQINDVPAHHRTASMPSFTSSHVATGNVSAAVATEPFDEDGSPHVASLAPSLNARQTSARCDVNARELNAPLSDSLMDYSGTLRHWNSNNGVTGHPTMIPATIALAANNIREVEFVVGEEHYPYSEKVCECTMRQVRMHGIREDWQPYRCDNHNGRLEERTCSIGCYNVPGVGPMTARLIVLFFQNNGRIPDSVSDLCHHWNHVRAFVKRRRHQSSRPY